LSYLTSYKKLSLLIQNESFEPMISWGLRMALSGTLPILWGLAYNRLNDAAWITLTAEAISWVEMKGSFSWRVRTLLFSAVLAMAFSLLGTITGFSVWLSVICMLFAGFLATLLKNIGDRASGLGLSVYLTFIIFNAYPATDYTEVKHRMLLVAVGAAWPVLVGLFISLLMPAEEPFRRQIALIWRSVSALAETVLLKDTKNDAAFKDDIYLKEKDIRTAIDNSYQFYGKMVHQVSNKDNQKYQLALLRKIAGLVGAHVIAIAEEMEFIDVTTLDEGLRVKAATLLGALKEAVSRMSVFVITTRPEDKLLTVSQVNRLKNLVELIRQYPLPADEKQRNAINRILQLSERISRLMVSALQRMEQMGRDVRVFRSYSLIKTSFILKPRYLLRNIRTLFNFSSHTTRYALRSAIAAAIGLFIYKWFNIDHGYWMPFSVMIIIQPYFGATFKKAMDRIAGTLLGGIAGGLVLQIPTGMHVKEVILFFTFIFMVYFIRRNYAVAAFVITINLVLLFNIEAAFSYTLLATRAICTIGGALLAIAAGFALLPTWDKKWLPAHLADAINCNYEYFRATFFSAPYLPAWTKNKRHAESKNSDVFDSFNRYLQEPGNEKSEVYYDLITHNIRITRNLNNIHLEQEEKRQSGTLEDGTAGQAAIMECLQLFNKVRDYLPGLSGGIATHTVDGNSGVPAFSLNEAQMRSVEKLKIELKTMLAGLQLISV
jgi:uncharacterized membrane protein YgaE (UPF0421/DUF939 family)